MSDAIGNVSEPVAASDAPVAPAPLTSHGVRVLQNTAIVFIGRFIGVVLAASANVLLVRYLGANRLGQYGAIYAYLTLFTWIASFGLNQVVAREAAQHREQAGSIVFTGVCISGGFTLISVVAALAFSPLVHLNGKLFSLLLIASLEILLLVPFSLPGVIFQVDFRQWFGSGFSVVRQGLWFGIVVGLYLMGASLLYVVLGRLAVATIETGLNWHVGHKFLASPHTFIWPVAFRLVRGGFVLALATAAAAVYMRIDQVMLHRMASDIVLGHYVAAVRVSELFELVPAAFVSSLFPLLCISAADPPRFRRHLDLGYRYMVLAAAGLAVFFCVGARPIVHLFYGAPYSATAPLLAVLIWSELPIFYGTMLNNGLVAKGLQRFLLWPTVLGAAVNIALNIYLIPRWGAMGATWATVGAYWLCWTLALTPFQAPREILWMGLRLLAPITGLALLVTGAAFLLPTNDWVRLGGATSGFATLACILGFARKHDLKFVSIMWRTRLGTRNA
jgi:O-antigen/teichoic acid export membrane protein